MGEKESKISLNYEIAFGKTFNTYFTSRFDKRDVDKIVDFILHFQVNGFKGWKGKYASSSRVPLNYPNREDIIFKAEFYNLWHVHIGIPLWKKSQFGDYYVSDWVLHFKKESEYKIILLELDSHNPMKLPSEEICKE